MPGVKRGRATGGAPLAKRRKTDSPPETESESLVTLGIDMGTTLTCVAFSSCKFSYNQEGKKIITDDDKDVHLVRFNSDQQQSSPLFENICTFDKNELLIGPPAQQHAERLLAESNGNSETTLLRFLKLGICGDISMSRLADKDSVGMGDRTMGDHLRRIAETCRSQGMGENTYELVARFIKQLWDKYIKRDIKATYSHLPSYSNIENAKVEVVVTRPSIWSFVEDQKFVNAIEKALEHVAVANIAVFDEAHAVLTGMTANAKAMKNLFPGNVVLVLDLGGGTADLASIELITKKTFKDAGVPSRGGIFGATVVTTHFEEALQSLVQPVYQNYSESLPSSPSSRSISWNQICRDLVKQFEINMKGYAGCSPGELNSVGLSLHCVNLPGVPNTELDTKGYVLRHNLLEIKHFEMQRLFNLCINGIIGLTKAQILDTRAHLRKTPRSRKDIKGLYVVGGFSKNEYLQKTLVKKLEDDLNANRIYFPMPFEKSAVATGAAMYAKNRNLLEERLLQANIGFVQSLEVYKSTNPILPDQFDIQPCEINEAVVVFLDAVRWVYMKGEAIPQDCERSFRGFRYTPLDGEPMEIEEDLFCAPLSALDWIDKNNNNVTYAPRDRPDAQISKFGTLSCTIECPAEYSWYRETCKDRKGVPQAKIDYEVTVRWDGLRLHWTLLIPAAGHFDCKEAECPGAKHSQKCVGNGGLQFNRTANCNLGAAFGDEQSHAPKAPKKEKVVSA